MAAIVAFILLAACARCAAGVAPNTSLATLPVAYFGGVTAKRPAENIAMLARMRLVMIEKWEGHCWADCITNTSAGKPCDPLCHGELDMLATLRAVKEVNPHVSAGYYQNSLYDWTFQLLDAEFSAAGGNMKDKYGNVIGLEQDNGLKHQNVFDLGNPATVDAWLNWQRNLSQTGFVDGSFCDKPNVYPMYNTSAQSWQICEDASGPGKHTFADACALITAEQAQAYTAGRKRLMSELPTVWRPKGGFVLATVNGTMQMIRLHNKPNALIRTVRDTLADPTKDYAYLHNGDQQCDHDPTDITSDCKPSDLALALIAIEPGTLIGCNGWDPVFEKPLGDPEGPATMSKHIYTRKFKSGTTVSYNENTGQGTIHWADGTVTK